MPDSQDISKSASLVPEIFYDVIARIPPGTLLALAVISLLKVDLFSSNGGYPLSGPNSINVATATILGILLLMAGYVIGLLLTQIGAGIHHIYIVWFWRSWCNPDDYKAYVAIATNYRVPGLEAEAERHIYECIDRELHEYVKKGNNSASTIIPKMRAEMALCLNLAAGVLIYTICYTFAKSPGELWKKALLILAIFSLTISAAIFREHQLLRRTLAYVGQIKKESERTDIS
jgi:hypothetical protein